MTENKVNNTFNLFGDRKPLLAEAMESLGVAEDIGEEKSGLLERLSCTISDLGAAFTQQSVSFLRFGKREERADNFISETFGLRPIREVEESEYFLLVWVGGGGEDVHLNIDLAQRSSENFDGLVGIRHVPIVRVNRIGQLEEPLERIPMEVLVQENAVVSYTFNSSGGENS